MATQQEWKDSNRIVTAWALIVFVCLYGVMVDNLLPSPANEVSQSPCVRQK